MALTDREFADRLNDIYGEVEICGMRYPAGFALQCVDEIAFDLAMADYESTLEDEEDRKDEDRERDDDEYEGASDMFANIEAHLNERRA